ncbi:MAG: diacylglycerol/lipid kinase family protein [Candidatus Xenobiia bacterium LiM19]
MDRPSSIKKFHAVVNPASGSPQPVLRILNDTFKGTGIAWDVSLTHRGDDARTGVERALREGADIIGACGGDGTVMEVASALMGKDTPMAILPAGTANLLACELAIPQDLIQAASLITSKSLVFRAIDIGKVGDRPFALRLGIGHEARKVELADREMKDNLGVLAYSVAALMALNEPLMTLYRLNLDDRIFEVEGFSCMVANAGSFGVEGISYSPNIRIDDGLFDVFVLSDLNPNTVISALKHMFTGEYDGEEGFFYHSASRIGIETSVPQKVHVDGELWGETPVEVQVIPQAVRILVPPPEEQTD